MVMIILQSIAITALIYVSFICMRALNDKKRQMQREERDE